MRALIPSLVLVLVVGCSGTEPQRAGFAAQPLLPPIATPTPNVKLPADAQDAIPILLKLEQALGRVSDMSERDKVELQQAYEDYRADVERLSQILKENADAMKDIIDNIGEDHAGADWSRVAVFLAGFCTAGECDSVMREFTDDMCVAFGCKPEPTPSPK